MLRCAVLWLASVAMLTQSSASDINNIPSESNEETKAGSAEHAIKTVKGLAELVENMTTDPLVTKEAEHVKSFIDQGSLSSHREELLDFLDDAEVLITPEVAAEHGLLVSRNDLDEINDVQHSQGIFANPESAAKGAFEGDIMPARASDQDSGKNFGAGKPWPDAIVKYCVDAKINPYSEKAFKNAVFRIRNDVPGIQFKDIGRASEDSCTEVPSLFVTSANTGCWSELGMIWDGFPGEKSQHLNLKSPGCDNTATALHELLHAMGMAHEHVRPDRNEYVQVHEGNIKDGKGVQFAMHGGADTSRPYDILSIMHYDEYEFSKQKGRLPTITVKDKGYQVYTNNPSEYNRYRLGQRMGMSKYDIAQLADLYGCSDDRRVCQPADPGLKLFHIILIVASTLSCCVLMTGIAYTLWKRKSKTSKGGRRENDMLLEEERRAPGTPAAGRQKSAGSLALAGKSSVGSPAAGAQRSSAAPAAGRHMPAGQQARPQQQPIQGYGQYAPQQPVQGYGHYGQQQPSQWQHAAPGIAQQAQQWVQAMPQQWQQAIPQQWQQAWQR